jgi:LAO/AO transport system kinase
MSCSALTGMHISEVWDQVQDFVKATNSNGEFHLRRQQQLSEWLDALLQEALSQTFFGNQEILQLYKRSKTAVLEGRQTPTTAVNLLINAFTHAGY